MVVTLISAGHETTATAIAWGAVLLAHDPPSRHDDDYLDAMVKEILRIRSPLPVAAARHVLEPFPIGRWTIPPQVMVIVDGSVDMAIEGEWQTLRPGDVVVVNRGLEHELHSPAGVTFFEALSPVPLDHVPDDERDLVLGPDGGSQHVER